MATQHDDMLVEMTNVPLDSKGVETQSIDFDNPIITGAALSSAVASHAAPKKNSLCYDIFMPILVILLFAGGLTVILVANNWRANDPHEIAKIYHEKHPFIDGKNLLPYAIKAIFKGDVHGLNLNERHTAISTDLPRLRQGKVGGIVWSSSMPCGLLAGNEGPTAVERTLYQIDIIYQLIEKYASTFELVTSSDSALEQFADDKLMPSVISIEGGHQFHDDLSALRMFRKLGVVSMSLTADCSTSWAETENPYNTQYSSVKGITEFGLTVIEEMNRIGMMIDISRVSASARIIALQKSKAPVLFSQSGANALCNSTFNIPDAIFSSISKNGGVIMVPLFPPAICSFAAQIYDKFRAGSINSASMVQQYQDARATTPCGVEEVFQHIDYLRAKVGIARVGVSTLFDGNSGLTITGLEDASKLINLTARMVSAGYSENDVTKVIGGNYLSAWTVTLEKAVEIQSEERGPPAPTSIWHL